jgi:hypothetical protein
MGNQGRGRAGLVGITAFLGAVALSACSNRPVSPGLVPTTELGTVRGQSFVRAITHFHTPYSFDACDGKGYNADGTINRSCWADARYAFCENHINYIFATDHVNYLAESSFADLALLEAGDTLITTGGGAVGNQMACPNGFTPRLAIGLEGKLLALGMENHVSADLADRTTVYDGEDPVRLRGTGANDAKALVGVPHTESRDLITLTAIQPSFIEIYNVHANLDPKIRKKHLGRNPFDKIGVFVNYLADPYSSLNPDYMFLDFIEFNDVYFQRWDALVSASPTARVTGVGGLDSHENIFSQKAADGERLDHHRRMTRFINNLVLTGTDSIDGVKTAIEAGRVFFTVEGMGTPVGLDYHGVQTTIAGDAVFEMGEIMQVTAPATARLEFAVPVVHPAFPGMDSDERPEIRAELIQVSSSGAETVVAGTSSSRLVYSNPGPGDYRVHVYQKPRHLRELLFNEDLADQEFLWIVSNHIKVTN